MRGLICVIVVFLAGMARCEIGPAVEIQAPTFTTLMSVQPDPIGSFIILGENWRRGYESIDRADLTAEVQFYRQVGSSEDWTPVSDKIGRHHWGWSYGSVGSSWSSGRPLNDLIVNQQGTAWYDYGSHSSSSSTWPDGYSSSSSSTWQTSLASTGTTLWQRDGDSNWIDYQRPTSAPLRIQASNELTYEIGTGVGRQSVLDCNRLVAGPVRGHDDPLVLGQFGMEVRSITRSDEALTSETLVVYTGSGIVLRGGARCERGTFIVLVQDGGWAIDLVMNNRISRVWSGEFGSRRIGGEVIGPRFTADGRLIFLMTSRSSSYYESVMSLAEKPDGSFYRHDFTSASSHLFSSETNPWEVPAIALETGDYQRRRPMVICWDEAGQAWRSFVGVPPPGGDGVTDTHIGENAAGDLILTYTTSGDDDEVRAYYSVVNPSEVLPAGGGWICR